MRRALIPGLVLFLLLPFAGGCRTAVGNYFSNRARDFGECFRLEAGTALGAGVEVSAAGLVEVGAAWAITRTWGWRYGQPPLEVGEWFLWPGMHRVGPFTGRSHHQCPTLLPALLGATDWGTSIWYDDWDGAQWLRVHAFDVEVAVGLWPLCIRVGFSLGEFVDFLLGWFGLDVAGDDFEWMLGRVDPEERAP